jgi:hypothetical protein
MKRLIASSPFVLLPTFETSRSEGPSPQPRALAIVVVAISAWKTASAVILLFVLSVATSSPAHHDKRGVGHTLFNDRPGVRRLIVLTTPSDGYTMVISRYRATAVVSGAAI